MQPEMGASGGPVRPMTLGDVISAAFDLYKQHWKELMAIVAVVAIPLTLLQHFVGDQLIRNSVVTNVKTPEQAVAAVSGTFWRAIAAGLVVSLIGFLITMILTGAITRGAAGTLVGEQITIEAMYNFGIARLGSIILVSFLVGLVVLGGLILLIVPGIIFAVRLVLAVPVLVVEGKRGREALSRSWNLVKGNGWHVFGTLLVAGIITGFVASIFTAPFSGWVARGIAGGIGSVITMPFSTLVSVLLYLDVRARKETFDVERLRQDLQASAA